MCSCAYKHLGMYIYEYTQTLTYMMFITELFTKLSSKLLGLHYTNACVWVERKQITNKCVLYDSFRGETISAHVQAWASPSKKF